MSYVYLLTSGSIAKKDNQRLLIEKNNSIIASMPFNDVECVIVNEGCNITTPVIDILLNHKKCIFFVDFSGHLRGSLTPANISNYQFKRQIEVMDEKNYQTILAQNTIKEKLLNQRQLLKNISKQKKLPSLNTYTNTIKTITKSLMHEKNVDTMRGLEGIAAKEYFDAFKVILANTGWNWLGRSRRPAKDKVNALLNYGYAFLERETRLAIVATNLDPRIGFLHCNNGKKDSLVFDLMELFRQPIIDRFIMNIINRKQISPDHIKKNKQYGYILDETIKATWIHLYENYMEKPLQSLEGLSPREYIRNKVKNFSYKISKLANSTTEREALI